MNRKELKNLEMAIIRKFLNKCFYIAGDDFSLDKIIKGKFEQEYGEKL